MSALDDDVIGSRSITDLDELAQCRVSYWVDYGIFVPLQGSEVEAGLSEADICRSTNDALKVMFPDMPTDSPLLLSPWDLPGGQERRQVLTDVGFTFDDAPEEVRRAS